VDWKFLNQDATSDSTASGGASFYVTLDSVYAFNQNLVVFTKHVKHCAPDAFVFACDDKDGIAFSDLSH
jgi:hypothetical protein